MSPPVVDPSENEPLHEPHYKRHVRLRSQASGRVKLWYLRDRNGAIFNQEFELIGPFL